MPRFYSTKQVAVMLGLDYPNLSRALWLERIHPMPMRGPSGSYLFVAEDVRTVGKTFYVPDVVVNKALEDDEDA